MGKVLRGEKFRWPEEEIWKAQRQISKFTDHVTAVETLNIVSVDPAKTKDCQRTMKRKIGNHLAQRIAGEFADIGQAGPEGNNRSLISRVLAKLWGNGGGKMSREARMEEIDRERGRGSPKALPKAAGAPAMVRTVFRATLIWLLMMAAETVHGALRTWFLAPYVGDFRARQIGALVGSAIILVLAYLFIEWIGADDARALWSVGLLWLGLTLSFEFAFGRFAFGYSWQRIFEDYDVFKGGLLLFGVVFMALSPLAASSLRRRARRAAARRM